MVGMLDGAHEELIPNIMQLIKYIYKPALESLLFFADEDADRNCVYEEILMTVQSLYSSLKGRHC